MAHLCPHQESLMHCKENPIYGFLFWELSGLSPNFHIHVSVSDLYIPRIGPHIFLHQNRQTNPANILKISHRYMSVGTGRQNIIMYSVLEITVSFLGIHKWEPDIYIGFSPALHLQCGDDNGCGFCGSQLKEQPSDKGRRKG